MELFKLKNYKKNINTLFFNNKEKEKRKNY